jgi:competence ComEA-like helix-hairpin-helix protein
VKLRVFFTKSEYGSLILTVVFLLVISGVFWRVGPKPSSADYTVTTERTAAGVTPAAGPEAAAGRVNLNTASAEELQSLPGIGEVLAARIIEYREQSGPFACPEELMAVKGIGESLFDAVSGWITTEE